MEKDLYCKIYVDFSCSKIELVEQISNIVQGDVLLRSIKSKTMDIDVMANDDIDKDKAGQKNGFVYYPYYLEIDAVERENSSAYIEDVNHLLKELQSYCNNAVASCDFEDELSATTI